MAAAAAGYNHVEETEMAVQTPSIELVAVLLSPERAVEIPEKDDVYGWLCGRWDLEVLRYRGIDVAGHGLRGEIHAARVLEGRAVQDVWIMPRRDQRNPDSDPKMNMYGTTLRSWDASIGAWRIAWTNPVHDHREEQIGRRNGTGILQEGVRLDGTKTRWTFTEITVDAFRWRGEALYAGRDQWALEGEFLATRFFNR
jgi:hypothetical protein